MIKVGDRLIVNNLPFPAFVEAIQFEPETYRTIVYLNWREHGKSKVYMHDENKTWKKYLEVN